MDQRVPPARALKIVACIVVLSALAALILWAWTKVLEERGWAAMERRIDELTAKARARRYVRPILRGQAVAGNAWDEYLLALDDANRRPMTMIEIPEAGVIANFWALNGSLIEHLRRGAQCSDVAIPLSTETGSSRIFPTLRNWDPLWKTTTRYTRLLVAQGEYREAAQRLAELYLVGCDLSRNAVSDMDGPAMEIRRHALDELRILVVDRRLPGDVLLLLEKELAILDGMPPDRALIVLNDTARVGRVLLLEPAWEDHLFIGKQGMPAFDWRHAFSKRLLAIDLFKRVDDWNCRAARAVEMPWPEALRVHRAVGAELRDCGDVFFSLGLQSVAWAAWARATQAKLRLLRVAVHFRLNHEVLPLDDPFGTQLLYQGAGSGHLKVWSLGAFDRGEPEHGPWADANPTGEDHLVIEVDR